MRKDYAPLAKRYLTISDAAERLQVTDRSIRNWISDGRIKAVRVRGGRAIRIPEASLATLLEPIPAGGTNA